MNLLPIIIIHLIHQIGEADSQPEVVEEDLVREVVAVEEAVVVDAVDNSK